MVELKKLVCDVCGGGLQVQAGGKFGVCKFCGTEYTIERMREMYSGMKVSVTGSQEDVEQWKRLIPTYLEMNDYDEASRVAKKILEADPSDSYALDQLRLIQKRSFMEIDHGVLVKYHGRDSQVEIPEGITKIGKEAFANEHPGEGGHFLRVVVFPSSVEEIGEMAFAGCSSLTTVVFANGLRRIGDRAFLDCTSLVQLDFPETLESIDNSFVNCAALRRVHFSERAERRMWFTRDTVWFRYCDNLAVTNALEVFPVLPVSLFFGCGQIRERYRRERRCPGCGQTDTKGLLSSKCKVCGEIVVY